MTSPGHGRRMSGTSRPRVDAAAVGVMNAVLLLALAGFAVLRTDSEAASGEASRGQRGQRVDVLVDDAVDGCPRFAPPPGTRTTVVTGSAAVDDLAGDGSLRHGQPGEGMSSAAAQTPARGQAAPTRGRCARPALPGHRGHRPPGRRALHVRGRHRPRRHRRR